MYLLFMRQPYTSSWSSVGTLMVRVASTPLSTGLTPDLCFRVLTGLYWVKQSHLVMLSTIAIGHVVVVLMKYLYSDCTLVLTIGHAFIWWRVGSYFGKDQL
jgi:hypothetical protein